MSSFCKEISANVKTDFLKHILGKEKLVLIFVIMEEDFVSPLFTSPILQRFMDALLSI